MTTTYYSVSGAPATSSSGSSATMRAEFALIEAGFALLPSLTSALNRVPFINPGSTAITTASTFTFDGTTLSFPAGSVSGAFAAGSYTNNLSAFAATTSAQLAGVMSDETGSGSLVFSNSPVLVSPALGTPSSGVLTSCTGYPGTASLVTTGTVASGTWSASFGAVSGANLTSITAANISAGTAGINISGNAATATYATSAGSATTATSATNATTATGTNALYSATTTVNVSSATAPSSGQVLTATGSTAATWQTPVAGATVPTGAMFDYAGAGTIPAGYLACDGSNYATATYSALSTVLGTTWGAPGGGSFTVPDSRRRVSVGSGGTAVSGPANTVGSVGGEETHVQSTAEIAAHTHANTPVLASGTISATTTGTVNGTTFNAANGAGKGTNVQQVGAAAGTVSGSVGTSITANNSSIGSSTAFNVMQPSYVVQKIIKT